MHARYGAIALFCGGLLAASAAHAQHWPSKPIVIVTTGASEAVPRILGDDISKTLGQNIVVEAHAGASGTIAAEYTLRQPADGYVFLNATSALMAAPNTFDIKYDVLRDFAPVSLLATAPFILVAHPSLPVRSLKDLIALAKRRPGELNFSSTSPGSSSSITAALFLRESGINLTHVSYKTMGAALLDLLAGQVQLCMSAGPNAVAQIRAGKARALAVSTPKRFVVLPEVPTFAELGYPKVALTAWYGLLARAGTPQPIISRLSAVLLDSMRKPDIREKLLKAAVEPVGDTPQEFATFLKEDYARWADAAKAAHLSKSATR
jgi:tripartite-type tricarboxylate transporter receptor subunit TctC